MLKHLKMSKQDISIGCGQVKCEKITTSRGTCAMMSRAIHAQVHGVTLMPSSSFDDCDS